MINDHVVSFIEVLHESPVLNSVDGYDNSANEIGRVLRHATVLCQLGEQCPHHANTCEENEVGCYPVGHCDYRQLQKCTFYMFIPTKYMLLGVNYFSVASEPQSHA